jgi:hypothetical protein
VFAGAETAAPETGPRADPWLSLKVIPGGKSA